MIYTYDIYDIYIPYIYMVQDSEHSSFNISNMTSCITLNKSTFLSELQSLGVK